MEIHAKIGTAFAVFCTGLVVWHFFTPSNPQHWVAMITMSIWACLFTVSAIVPIGISRYIQSLTLLTGAAFTVYFGNFPVAAVISTLAVLIFWAYNGFKTFFAPGAIMSFSLIFSMFFFGVLVSGYGHSPAFFIALVWTGGVSMAFLVIWLIFLLFASSIVAQNRDLLELNKKLKQGDCQDVAAKRG